MAKVHLETGKFGEAACGKDNVDTTTDPALVDCKSCQETAEFQAEAAAVPHQHEWWQRNAVGPLIVNEDGTQERAIIPDGVECKCGATLTQAEWSARSPS